MLKKLLKYDLISVVKYWWIAAIATVALSVVAGSCISILEKDTAPDVILTTSAFMLVFSILGILAFVFLSIILVYVRFYKNFFTDEGYLTFTLPVKRSQLINSKLIASTVILFSSIVIVFVDIYIILAVAGASNFLKEFAMLFVRLFENMTIAARIHIFVFFCEFVIFILLVTVLESLFIFCCISFASLIAKKAKVITAIGVYYAVNGVITTVLQLATIFGITSIAKWISSLSNELIPYTLHLIFIAVLLLVLMVCSLLYLLQYFLLDRKLNLN